LIDRHFLKLSFRKIQFERIQFYVKYLNRIHILNRYQVTMIVYVRWSIELSFFSRYFGGWYFTIWLFFNWTVFHLKQYLVNIFLFYIDRIHINEFRAHQYYYFFGFLLVEYIILIITCSETTILLCYYHLCAEVRFSFWICKEEMFITDVPGRIGLWVVCQYLC
jgi:hypothetical protein